MTAQRKGQGETTGAKGLSGPKPKGTDRPQAREQAGAAEAAGSNTIIIPAIRIGRMEVRIVGDSPLLMNKMSDAAKDKLKAKAKNEGTAGRAAQDADKEYRATMHCMSRKRYGFPASAFKHAIVRAAILLADKKNVPGTRVKGGVSILEEENGLIEIAGKPIMDERWGVRPPRKGTPALIYRASFMPWSCTLHIRYNEMILGAQQIVQLLDHAGFSVGIGSGRFENSGTNGMFHIQK